MRFLLLSALSLVAVSTATASASTQPKQASAYEEYDFTDCPGIHKKKVVAIKPKVVASKPKGIAKVTKKKHKAPKHKATAALLAPAASIKSQVAPASARPWTQQKTTGIKHATPTVANPSLDTLKAGAAEVISSFASNHFIDPKVEKALIKALHKAIAEQMAGEASASLAADAAAKTPAAVSSSHAVEKVAVTTSAPAKKIKASKAAADPSSTAALAIQKAIDSAFAAVKLAETGLDSKTVASLESCLSTVLSSGGLPAGYACLTKTGSNSAGLQETLNTILEQFEGILPNKILTAMFDSVMPSLTALLPDNEQTLVDEIRKAIESVTATLTGSSVTALEQASTCYTNAIQQQGNISALACYTSSGAAETMRTASNSVTESFVGVLPAALITSVQNILNYNLATANGTSKEQLAGQVQAQISSAISSAGATLSGNLVSIAETMQACAAILISTGNGTAAQECITKGDAPALTSTIVRGIAEQFQGYLPSAFFTDLVKYSSSLLASSSTNPKGLDQGQLNQALDSYFNNATSYGPAYVSCLEQVQDCVTKAIKDSGKIDSVCAGPVAGCSLPINRSTQTALPKPIVALVAPMNATDLAAPMNVSSVAAPMNVSSVAAPMNASSSSMVAPSSSMAATSSMAASSSMAAPSSSVAMSAMPSAMPSASSSKMASSGMEGPSSMLASSAVMMSSSAMSSASASASPSVQKRWSQFTAKKQAKEHAADVKQKSFKHAA